MATDFTQDSVLGFLQERGGTVRSSELVEHFKAAFPEEPRRKAAARQTFKNYVDNVAFVRTENGEKHVCLKKKFRSETERDPSRYLAAADQVSGDDAPAAPPPRAASLSSGYGNDSGNVPRCFTGLGSQKERSVCGKSVCVAADLDGGPGEMGGRHSSVRDAEQGGHALDIPEITLIEPSPLPVEERAFTLPEPAQVNTGEADLLSTQDQEDEWSSDSEGNSTPRASRKHFLKLMMSSSPQVRRSLVQRSSAYLSNPSDSDSASLDDEQPSVALDPLEHAWMMSASDAEWAGLQHLLTAEPSLVLRKDFVTGFTCLHWAAKHGKPEVIALIVNFAKQHHVPISVDARSNTGYTPLHVAAMHGHMEVVKLLVGAYGADVEIRDYSGRKACHYLTDGASVDIRDIIGAYEHCEVENGARKAGAGRWRFSKVLQSNLNPLQARSDSVDGEGRARQSVVRRKSSFGRIRPNLEKLRQRTSQLVRSSTFRDQEDGDRASRRGSFLKRKTHFFG